MNILQIPPSNQRQMVEQPKFTYSFLGKTFEKQIKTTNTKEENKLKF